MYIRPVDHLAHINRLLLAARFTGWNQWLDERPLGVCQIARVAKLAEVIESAVLIGPHRRPFKSKAEAWIAQKGSELEAKTALRASVLRAILQIKFRSVANRLARLDWESARVMFIKTRLSAIPG
jgi:hypothetical protein